MKRALCQKWLGVWMLCVLLASCAITPPVTEVPQTENLVASQASTEVARVTIAAVGDMMLGGKAHYLLEKEGYDYPFAATKQLLQQADITIGNLETPLTERGELLTEKKYRFRNPPDKVAPALRRAGFDIVSLANNHSLDYGYQGLQDTFDVLTKYGIRYHGAGENSASARKPVIFDMPNGQRVGVLAYSNTFPEEFWAGKNRPGTAFGHERHVKEDVALLAAQNIDIIVVSFHWGQERSTELRHYQPLLAHTAIDAGADLVIGHHPHILQGVEKYKQGLILYSLGNFTFGTYSNEVKNSVVATVAFEDGQFAGLEMVPININNFQVELQPQILAADKAQAVFDHLSALSAKQSTKLSYREGVIVLDARQLSGMEDKRPDLSIDSPLR